MRHEIGGHERAVAVPADAHAVPIRYAHFHRFIDGRLRVHHDLVEVGVVHRLGIVADDRHGRVVEHRVAMQQEEQLRRSGDGGEALHRSGDLAGRRGVVVFERIRPHHGRAGACPACSPAADTE